MFEKLKNELRILNIKEEKNINQEDCSVDADPE